MNRCSASCPRHPAITSILVLLAVSIAMAITGCSGSTSPASPPTPVQPAPVVTTTNVTATPSTVVAGQTVALAATVKLFSGSPAAGSLTFNDGTTSLGSAPLDTTGAASLSLTTLAVGTHSITAAFAGSSTQAASASAAVTVTVAAIPKAATTQSLSVPGATVYGDRADIHAYITAVSGATVPTGTVTFRDQNGPIGTAALDLTGRAITTVTTLAAGVHQISLDYSGDANFAPAGTAPILQLTVNAVPAPSYTNPLKLTLPTGGTAVSCADPATIKVQTSGVNTWYLYCTSDALYAGDPATHFINIFESKDLVTWTYDGNAFAGLPAWAPNGLLWAPAIKFFNGQYYLYYTSPSSNQDALGGAAIGVGISASPKGPFIDHGTPVVEPEPTLGNCCNGRDRSTLDPDVVQDTDGQRYISFGSFDGGIFLRKLSADGFTSDGTSEIQIGATNRYEGGNLWQHGPFWYLFASSSNCCNGPLTGYAVFVGRASTPLGPFLDSTGTSMAANNAGGQEVLAQNGNRWLGPGGNVLFTDEAGQDYMLFHAIPADAPVYAGTTSYTARPALIDTVGWDGNNWPFVNGGAGPSTVPRQAPSAQPGVPAVSPIAEDALLDLPGTAIASLSDEFNGTSLASQWSTLHVTPAYTFSNGAINLPTVSLDSCCQMSVLPMLVENAPATDYVVEARITMNLPVTGSGYDFAQGELFIYGDDQNFLRSDLFSSATTRQVEFNKQMSPNPAFAATAGYSNLPGPSVAGGVVSVYLRIVKRTVDGQATYTAYTSQTGADSDWHRGATWKHTLSNEKIGIAGGNRAGFIASFDYVRVSTLF